MNRTPLIIISILLLVIAVEGAVFLVQNSRPQAPDNTTQTQEVVQIDRIIPEFTDDMSPEEARGLVFQTYKNENIRIVGAVVESVSEDTLVVKTYRAGEGTSSIVEVKTIAISQNVPVYETILSTERGLDNAQVSKKTTSSLQKGDRIVIECAENKKMESTDVLTAVLITKDVLVLPEPELELREEVASDQE